MTVKDADWARKKAAELRERIAHCSRILSGLPFVWGQPDAYRSRMVRKLRRSQKNLAAYEAQIAAPARTSM